METADLVTDIRQYRLDNALTWKRLSDLIGISDSAIWKISHRKVTPTELTTHRIRQALGLEEPHGLAEAAPEHAGLSEDPSH